MFSSLLRRVFICTHNNKFATMEPCHYVLKSNFNTSNWCFSDNSTKEPTNEKQGKSKAYKQSPIVTLIGIDGSQSVVTLDEASKLANRRSLKLIQHKDVHLESKGRREIYKLVANKDLFGSTNKKVVTKSSYLKGEKKMDINIKITDHHLDVKIKSVIRWLLQSKQVHINISGKESGRERITVAIEDQVKEIDGKIIQTIERGDIIQLIVNPNRPKKQNVNKTSTGEEDNVENKPTTVH